MLPAMTREEGDALAADLANRDWRRRLPVRRLDLDLLDILEERVEARSPEDADAGPQNVLIAHDLRGLRSDSFF